MPTATASKRRTRKSQPDIPLDASRFPTREELEVELAKRTLIDFTVFTNPDYEVNFHHVVVAEALDRVLDGKCKRLMVLMPPQNGKSELVSRRFPAYALGKKPRTRIIAASYGDDLAQDMSLDVQKVMSTREYSLVFPDTRLATPRDIEKKTQGQFGIVGKRGYYVATGIMGSMTGRSLDIGIIDDPVKNREQAESETFRNKIWEQYKSSFLTRQFGSDCAIIICLTRWHEDDLAGRLLKLAAEDPNADQWEVVAFPAIQEDLSDLYGSRPYDTRPLGAPLWEAKYPLIELYKRKATGEYDWAALYQQRPAPAGGGLFKKAWFAGKIVDAAPALMRMARGWDTAGTPGAGDWTVGCKIGEEFVKNERNGKVESTGRFFVLDIVREQLDPGGVDALFKLTADTDGKVPQREEQEGGASGVTVIAARLKLLKGHDYAGVTISGSKIVRSKPFRAQCEGGNVYILRATWNKLYIDELCSFPTGTHDDQVDASSCAFNSVLLEPVPEPDWVLW